MNNLREIAQKFNIDNEIAVYENEEMARRFSFKIGGKTSLLIEPLTEDALLRALNFLVSEKVPYFILGGGTNIVFSDSGFDGVVVATGKLNEIEMVNAGDTGIDCNTGNGGLCSAAAGGQENSAGNTDNGGVEQADIVSKENTVFNTHTGGVILKCQCGAQMNTIVNFAVKNNLAGLEEFCGLPGTCGGACYMNARCFNKEISNVAGKIVYLEKVSVTNGDAGKENSDCNTSSGGQFVFVKKTLDFDKSLWAYKISPFTNTERVVVSVEFNVTPEATPGGQENTSCNTLNRAASLGDRAASFMKERVEKGHFKFPCAGSVFKNNRSFGKPTGQIVDELGLKGHTIGGAQIAPWHGNIIINKDHATSKDVKDLVEFVKIQVKEKTGFELEEEILFY